MAVAFYGREAALLDLYHHGSSACAAKVRLALAEKQLTWTSNVDILKGEQFSPEYLAINPKGVVPVLIDDGVIIPESTVICEYVEDAFPENPIYPASPKERAKARLWTKAVDEELHPACSALTYVVSHRHTILRNGVDDFDTFLAGAGANEGASARTLKWQWIQQGLAAPGASEKIQLYDAYLHRMERALGEGRWLTGDTFSIADIALAPYVNRLDDLAMDGMWSNGRLPKVEAWFDRVRDRPTFHAAFIAWMPVVLGDEMRVNGTKSWPDIKQVLGL